MDTVGVVFSGGIAKGAYQLGAARALREYALLHDVRLSIVGASVGVLTGYALATNQLDETERIWRSLNQAGVTRFLRHIIRNGRLYSCIDTLTGAEFDSRYTLHASCSRWPDLALRYFALDGSGRVPLGDVLKASVTIPKLLPPVEIGEEAYVDAALVDNTPVGYFGRHPVDRLVVVHFDPQYKIPNTVQASGKIVEVVFPQVCHSVKPSFDFTTRHVEEMLEVGYHHTHSSLTAGLASHRNTAPLTGDMVVNRLNRLLQRHKAAT